MDPELLSKTDRLPTSDPKDDGIPVLDPNPVEGRLQTADGKPTPMSKDEMPKSENDWKGLLTPERYHVLREKGTERPFGRAYDEFKHEGEGEYVCAGCGAELFSSAAKFDSGCGWPSFYEGLDKSKITEHEDNAFGMRRVEVTCANCGGHLGHVFPDGYGTPTGLRYCINAVSIEYIPQN